MLCSLCGEGNYENQQVDRGRWNWSIVSGVLNTLPSQLVYACFSEDARTKSSFSKADFEVFAGSSFKHKVQEKAISSKFIPSENLMSRSGELMPLAALSQHLVSELIH